VHIPQAARFPNEDLIHAAPSAFETFFTGCVQEFARSDPSDMSHIVEISAEHRIHYTHL
jgi:hypothetical protein